MAPGRLEAWIEQAGNGLLAPFTQGVIGMGGQGGGGRIGLRKGITRRKWRSLSVTTAQPFARAMAATIMSRALRGCPLARPSAMSPPQTSAAGSSKERTRPANSDRGPSGPTNHVSAPAACGRVPDPGCHARSRPARASR